jgi:hypothetical protein
MRRMGWEERVARMGVIRKQSNILDWKRGGKRPLGRPRRGWEDNTKMDVREIRWEGVDWIHLAQNREYNETSGSIKGRNLLTR